MLKWEFHQFSGYKRPFVWRIYGATASGRPLYEFVPGVFVRRSQNEKFGDLEFAIRSPGLYKIGNTKQDNGFRYVFVQTGIWRYRCLHDEALAITVARQIQAGESLDTITAQLADQLHWRFPYASTGGALISATRR